MIEHYKKPTIKFIVNKDNFNKLMEEANELRQNGIRIVLSIAGGADNFSSACRNIGYGKLADNIVELIQEYHLDGAISIINIALFPNEASELIVLLISAFDVLAVEKDYTEFMKRK